MYGSFVVTHLHDCQLLKLSKSTEARDVLIGGDFLEKDVAIVMEKGLKNFAYCKKLLQWLLNISSSLIVVICSE